MGKDGLSKHPMAETPRSPRTHLHPATWESPRRAQSIRRRLGLLEQTSRTPSRRTRESPAWQQQQGDVEPAVVLHGGDKMEVDHIIPKTQGGRERETTYNCCIDIVTIGKQPEKLVAKVRMTHATLLRSRMNGNVASPADQGTASRG